MAIDGGVKTAPLGTLVENHDSKRIPISSRERAARVGPFPYYGATGIMGYVDDYLFDGLYVLVAEDGSVEDERGHPIVQLVNGRFWVNNHAHVLCAPRASDTKFLYYALQTVGVRPYLNGSVQLKLNQRSLNSIPVPFPECPRRRDAIVNALGALDDKIELNRRMNEALEEIARALFVEWFVRGRVGSTAVRSDSHQAQVSVSRFFRILGGGTPKTSVTENWGGDIPWFSVVDTPRGSDVFVFVTDRFITERAIQSSSAKIVPPWTTIITARGTVGNLAVAAQPMAFNQSCYALVPRPPAGPCFVHQLAKHVVGQLQALAHGSVFSTITRSTFDAISVFNPSSRSLEDYEASVGPLYERIRSNVREASVLRDLRDTLLPKLVSGEVRLPEAEQLVSEVT